MNGYFRAAITMPYALIKLLPLKLFYGKSLSFGTFARISPGAEITFENGARLSVGCRFNMRSSAKIRVRKGGNLTIGDNTSLSHNCILACHESIEIGNDVQFSPGVLVYDHDHDFRAEGGLKKGKFKTSAVHIGNNVWIGANSVILRGTKIGDNSVIAAGSVIKGDFPKNSVIVQKRETTVINYNGGN